ncbi:uncharacterized protein EI90DRAFT_225545 [Cantharellus anzutake]|uniref:uncharacterized protein n=1 Tax=Cantharellus anzutake TaxID=1750568 RepID=UPI001907E5B8|nr:uncharacterized protein EI90DRAFT_225545 [Cantharellus anzutake]KAF8316501.1 hypothetical protein EI90DRAFT_225545 [Cantharellus anzutake]
MLWPAAQSLAQKVLHTNPSLITTRAPNHHVTTRREAGEKGLASTRAGAIDSTSGDYKIMIIVFNAKIMPSFLYNTQLTDCGQISKQGVCAARSAQYSLGLLCLARIVRTSRRGQKRGGDEYRAATTKSPHHCTDLVAPNTCVWYSSSQQIDNGTHRTIQTGLVQIPPAKALVRFYDTRVARGSYLEPQSDWGTTVRPIRGPLGEG